MSPAQVGLEGITHIFRDPRGTGAGTVRGWTELPGPEAHCRAALCSAGNDESCQAYMVQTGDTLAGIASEFDLYVGDLLTANPDIASNGTGLKPGAYIKLPPWCAAWL